MNFLTITTSWGRSDVVIGNIQNLSLVSPPHGMIVTWEEDQGNNQDVPLTQSICSGRTQNSKLEIWNNLENFCIVTNYVSY